MRSGKAVVAFLLALATPALAQAPVPREIRLATEPALQQSGLLDALIPPFQEAHGIRVSVKILAAKEALELGAAGGADVVFAHAPRLELQYVNQGFYIDRRLVMYTDHVLAGPREDPARVKGVKRVMLAFRKIAQARAPFVSAGERAGSYAIEQELWKKARVSTGPPWYIRVDADRKAALDFAATRRAYILTDRASVPRLLATGQLQVLLEGVRPLRSGYHVMEVNPHRFPRVNHPDARAFTDYLLSPPAQELIRSLSAEREGGPGFFPGAGKREADL